MKSYLFEALLRLLYPAFCATCQTPLALDEELLCSDCRSRIEGLAWPMEQCLLDTPIEHLDHIWTVFAYGSPFRELLHAVKYLRKEHFLNAVVGPAIAVAQAVTTEFVYDAMVPIPINHRKYMERHFNQVETLAKILDPWITPPIRPGLLRKIFCVPSQASLNREEREINVYGAFRVRDKKKVRGRAFLLIDDVFTTGATAKEAARVLKEAGAERVDLLALACTVRKPTSALSPTPALSPGEIGKGKSLGSWPDEKPALKIV